MARLIRSLPVASAAVFGLLLAGPAFAGTVTVDAGRGPVAVLVPAGYQPAVAAPLLLMLHGYTSSGAETEAILQFAPEADVRGILYAFPDGTTDVLGNRFWNATDACCNFFGSSVDDVGYLRDLIAAISAELTVDPARVFVAGHSNGGFMAYRFACEEADLVAAVVSVAGATFLDPDACEPAVPVPTLQIHGTADGTIAYDGGFTVAAYPGAVATTETWAAYNGCEATATSGLPPLDLDTGLPGAETTILRYETGCDDAPAGGPATSTLWTIAGGAHVPALSAAFTGLVADFLVGPRLDLLFADGFETGDTSLWSQVVP